MDAARGLDLAAVAHGGAHERHVVERRPALGEARARLHKRRASSHAVLAAAHNLPVVEQAALEDDLHGDARRSLDHGRDVARHVVVVALDEAADVHDHVDLGSPVRGGAGGLEGLGLGRHGAEGEPDAGGDAHARTREALGRKRGPAAVDGDGGEAVRARLVAELLDVGGGGVRLEVGVVDKGVEFHGFSFFTARRSSYP